MDSNLYVFGSSTPQQAPSAGQQQTMSSASGQQSRLNMRSSVEWWHVPGRPQIPPETIPEYEYARQEQCSEAVHNDNEAFFRSNPAAYEQVLRRAIEELTPTSARANDIIILYVKLNTTVDEAVHHSIVIQFLDVLRLFARKVGTHYPQYSARLNFAIDMSVARRVQLPSMNEIMQELFQVMVDNGHYTTSNIAVAINAIRPVRRRPTPAAPPTYPQPSSMGIQNRLMQQQAQPIRPKRRTRLEFDGNDVEPPAKKQNAGFAPEAEHFTQPWVQDAADSNAAAKVRDSFLNFEHFQENEPMPLQYRAPATWAYPATGHPDRESRPVPLPVSSVSNPPMGTWNPDYVNFIQANATRLLPSSRVPAERNFPTPEVPVQRQYLPSSVFTTFAHEPSISVDKPWVIVKIGDDVSDEDDEDVVDTTAPLKPPRRQKSLLYAVPSEEDQEGAGYQQPGTKVPEHSSLPPQGSDQELDGNANAAGHPLSITPQTNNNLGVAYTKNFNSVPNGVGLQFSGPGESSESPITIGDDDHEDSSTIPPEAAASPGQERATTPTEPPILRTEGDALPAFDFEDLIDQEYVQDQDGEEAAAEGEIVLSSPTATPPSPNEAQGYFIPSTTTFNPSDMNDEKIRKTLFFNVEEFEDFIANKPKTPPTPKFLQQTLGAATDKYLRLAESAKSAEPVESGESPKDHDNGVWAGNFEPNPAWHPFWSWRP